MTGRNEPIPDHVKAFLTDIGQWNTDGKSRLARLATCPGCRHPILAGLDADRAAMPATCDPHEIDANGELLALALNIPTYRLAVAFSATGKRGWNLDRRTKFDIECPQDTAIVAAHRCGLAIPPAPHSYLPPWTRRRAKTPTDQPDF